MSSRAPGTARRRTGPWWRRRWAKAAPGLAVAVLLGVHLLTARVPLRVRWELLQCRWIIAVNDMGWGTEVKARVDRLKRTVPDKRMLAETLVAQGDASLVAEGMALVAEQAFPDGDRLLGRFRDDTRWNYWMTYNNEWHDVCLAVWKHRRGMALSEAEKRLLREEQPLFDIPPAGDGSPSARGEAG